MNIEEYKRNEAEVEKLTSAIKAQGKGAEERWMDLSSAASAGVKEAKAACEDFLMRTLGHGIKSMLDLYIIVRASALLMTDAQKDVVNNSPVIVTQRTWQKLSDEYLANRLGDLRRAKGLTQEQLAHSACIPLVTLQKLENGRNRLLGARLESVLKIAAALGVTVEEIVNGQ